MVAGKVPPPPGNSPSPTENCPPENSQPRKIPPIRRKFLPRKITPPGKFPLRQVPLPRKSLEMYRNPLIHLLGLTFSLYRNFIFLQLRFFSLQLASLALGLRTLVGTGSRSTAFKELPASLFFLHNSKNKNRKNLKFGFSLYSADSRSFM